LSPQKTTDTPTDSGSRNVSMAQLLIACITLLLSCGSMVVVYSASNAANYATLVERTEQYHRETEAKQKELEKAEDALAARSDSLRDDLNKYHTDEATASAEIKTSIADLYRVLKDSPAPSKGN